MLERSFGGGGGLGGIFGPANRRQPQQPKTKNNISGVEGKPFFILAEVDKTEAFKGEPVVASWYLYTQGAISNIDTLKYPTLKGFWKEDIQIASILNFKETELINGQPYKKALLTSYALFPIEPGKAVVDRYRAKATVRLGFGFGQSKALTEESEPIPIFVKALPKTDQPKNFTGAVGRFQMSVDVVDKTVVQNQPFALKLRFDGQGNAKMIDLPELNLPKGVEIYDQSNESQYFKNGQSYKEFTLLLVPRESGELVLPMIQSSYFNPEEGSYSPLQSEEIKVKVLPGTKSLGIAEERLDSSSVPEKNKLPELRGQAMATARSSKSLPLWIGPILFIFVFLVGFFKFIFDTGIFAKEPDLRDIIKKRFKKIHSLGQSQDYRKVGIEVTNSIYHTLGDLSGLGGANTEFSRMMESVAPSIRRQTEKDLKQHLDYFGLLGFGPKSILSDQKVTSKTQEKIKSIENLLLKAVKLSKGHEISTDS